MLFFISFAIQLNFSVASKFNISVLFTLSAWLVSDVVLKLHRGFQFNREVLGIAFVKFDVKNIIVLLDSLVEGKSPNELMIFRNTRWFFDVNRNVRPKFKIF